VSQSGGVTYWRRTANSSSSGAPQLSHVACTRPTLTPTVASMAWRPAAVVLVVALGAAPACSDVDAPATSPTPPTTPTAVTESAGTTDTTTSTGATATTAMTTTPTTSGPAGVAPSGFDTVAGRVTAADGETCDVCLWAALTLEQQERGLMGVTDLSGADGMIFRFGSPTTIKFWMRSTPRALSIAFFAADGTFVSAADMEPCLTGPDADCARYAADAPYTDALEVAKGSLPDLLIGPGSRLDLTGEPCRLREPTT
jgi:uncharacterized membrane protein (UPF0127 family)